MAMEKKRFDLVGFGRIYLDFREFIGISGLDQRDAGPNWGGNVSGVMYQVSGGFASPR